MKKSLWLALMLAALLAPGGAWAAFTLEPISPETAKHFPGGAYGFAGNFQPMTTLAKEPKYPGSAKYGQLRIGAKQYDFVLFASQKEGKPDRIIIDLNEDKDLTNDPVVEFGADGYSKPVALKLGDKTVKVIAQLRNGSSQGGGSIQMGPAEWYRGQVDLGGKKFQAAIIDTSLAGRLQMGSRDYLLLDLNGDGRFDFNTETYNIECATMIQPVVALAGDTWNLTLDADKPDLTLTRYDGPCGQLALAVKLPKPWSEARVSGYLIGQGPRNTMLMVQLDPTGKPARFPAEEYQRAIFMLTPLVDGKPLGMVQLSIPDGKPLKIDADKTRTITIEPPKALEVTVSQNVRDLKIGRKLAGGDVDYAMIETPGAAGEMQPVPAPQVAIYPAGKTDAQPLAQGAMRYG